MTEVEVDEKHRITIPKELMESLGIVSGSVLDAVYKEEAIILVPKVPVKRPTQTLGGIAVGITEESSKKVAREAIAKRSIRKMKLRDS